MTGPIHFPKLPALPHVKLPKLELPQPVQHAVDQFVGGVRSKLSPSPSATPPTLPGSADARALHGALAWNIALSGGDADAVAKVLDGKTPSQMRDIRAAYSAEFGRTLDAAVDASLVGPGREGVQALLRGTSPSASALGDEVARAAWAGDHDHGNVPTAALYSTRNAFDGPYVNAKEIFPAMADSIASAKHEVDLELFDWNPLQFDKSGPWQNDPTMVLVDGMSRLQDRLKGEQAAGLAPSVPVKVYVAIDGPSRALHTGDQLAVSECRDLMRQLANAGLDPSLVEVHVGAHEWTEWGALHSKMLVVDGYKAIVTGANPQGSQSLNASWHDTGYGIRGEAGMGLRQDFDDGWKHCAEVVSVDPATPTGRPNVTTRSATAIDHAPEVLAPDLDADPALRDADLPMFLATHRPYDLRQGIPDGNSPQDAAWLATLANAKDVVKIESPNLNEPRVKDAIIAAVNRGVKVELVLSLGFNSSSERMTRAGLSAGGSNEDSIQDLYARIDDPAARARLQLHWNSPDGLTPTLGNGVGASHTKFMSADGAVAMVGSGNQDRASWNLIRETNVVVDGADAVGRCDGRVFDPDFARGIDAIALARDIRAGRVAPSPELDGFLDGDARAWSEKLLASYDR